MIKNLTFVLLISCLLSGCALVNKVFKNDDPDTNITFTNQANITKAIGENKSYLLDIAYDVSLDMFPSAKIEKNDAEGILIITVDRNNFITIKPETVFDKNGSEKGVLYDVVQRVNGRIIRDKVWKNFSNTLTKKHKDLKYITIESYKSNRDSSTLEIDSKINLELVIAQSQQFNGIDSLQCTFEDAINLAFDSAQSVFPNYRVEISQDKSSVLIESQETNRSFLFTVEPKIVLNTETSGRYGVLFSFKFDTQYVRAVTINAPKQKIINEIQLRSKEKYPIVHIPKYRISYDKGVPDTIQSSIPITYEGFKKYVDGKIDLYPFEGIWTESDGLYTLGIVYVENDPRFKYYAFVIDSKRSSWKNGEIKAKFTDLRNNAIATGEYRIRSKASFGLSWEVSKNLLKGVSKILDSEIYFIKSYPNGRKNDFVSGVGTAWAISNEGHYVTAAHVVEDADRIFIGYKSDSPIEASVIAIDQRLDLAVVKVLKKVKTKSLPIDYDTANNGEEVVAFGYPLAFQLGDDIKITTGIISSQTGHRKDMTNYQFTAPIEQGNSGGPIVDKYGNVIGVIVSTLEKDNVELINYAAKAIYLKPLLDIAGLKSQKNSGMSYSYKEIADMYKTSVLPIWVDK